MTLTVAQMPSHQHALRYDQYVLNGGSSDGVPYASNGSVIGQNPSACYASGGNGGHTNMPAYQELYAWRRTA